MRIIRAISKLEIVPIEPKIEVAMASRIKLLPITNCLKIKEKIKNIITKKINKFLCLPTKELSFKEYLSNLKASKQPVNMESAR